MIMPETRKFKKSNKAAHTLLLPRVDIQNTY